MKQAVRLTEETDALVQSTLRQLVSVWVDFETRLNQVPLIDKLNRQKFRMEDYQALLLNLRQQVVDGSRWISRAASSIGEEHGELRSRFIRHAVTEHRDYTMLEENYVAVGGKREDILHAEKNIGSEALSAWMFHRASQPNPFDLLGAMFIIEGLGSNKALEWGQKIQQQLQLSQDQVSFLLYHGMHDDDHMQQFEAMLASGIVDEKLAKAIVKTAKVTARLYALQLEELGNI